MQKTSLSLILVLITQMLTAQELTLPIIFNDHMVLQRNAEVRIWGNAQPNALVSILIGDFSMTTQSNENGEWETFLPKQKAGGPHTLIVESKKAITFEDVYFGDVWIAGGQSNMERPLNAGIIGAEEEIARSGEYPEIRFFRVPKTLSIKPLNDLSGGEWKLASPENAGNFSAVAWFFAKLNHLEKGVPVGIIDDNWGGTPAESWTPTTVLSKVPGYEEKVSKYVNSEKEWEVIMAENTQKSSEKYHRVEDTEEFLSYGVHEENYDDSNWDNVELPNKDPLNEFVWLRKSFNLNKVADAQLSFGNPGKFTVAFINGEMVYVKIWSDEPKIINIDKNLLKKGENVIAIRTVEDWDNRSFIGSETDFWISTEDEKIPLNGTWKFSNLIEPPIPEVVRYENEPGFLFNAMINPIAGYSINGAIWYQGESNVVMSRYYNVLFEEMITAWRDVWNQGDFPFLFVQLANFQQRYDHPTESDWARLQEAQTQTLSLNNTGMATIIDIGEANDIHPRNKKDVGYRLWQSALHVAYHENNIYSGPMYRGHVIDGDKVIISFDHIGKGLVNKKTAGDLPGFAIAGPDSVFHWATARIEGDTIVLNSDQVKTPVAIRYAWADNPEVALYNLNGLPAVPFRTDNW